MPNTTYSYSASIDNTRYLIGVIQANGILNTAGVTIVTWASLQPNQIDITLSDELSSTDKETLDAIVGSYTPAVLLSLPSTTNNFNLQQFREDIEAAEIVAANILFIDRVSGVVSINFDAELTAEESTALNSLFSDFVQLSNITRLQTIGMQDCKTESSVYEVLYTHIFIGCIAENIPKKIEMISKKDGSYIASYDARIVDFTNSTIVCEATGMTNQTEGFIDMGTISNVSETCSVWEIQLRANFATALDEELNDDFVILRGIRLGFDS